ncbi:MAG TPA: saccharopine dehydrogenase NADP-binding domain-containing protein [Sphingomonas sp.]|nr:saccharopine dehydrogenase NADP-binding domain-containing protein [Sphingomonas sp.]
MTGTGSRAFDLILYGATGYTGQLVADYIQAHQPRDGFRWAIAGRSAEKLAAVRDAIGAPADLPLILADSSDPASIRAMAESSAMVITAAGPYQLYGSDLVAACAAAGTDYLDLCGEPAWMAEMIPAHHAAAQASGARILFSSGFDSIPFDLGVRFLQDRAVERFGAPLAQVHGRVREMRGTFSGGTAASAGATAAAARDPAVLARILDPFSLTPGFEGPTQPEDRKPREDPATGSWVTPFMMAPINTKNVHRTNFLLGHPYGQDFRYDEMLMTGPGEQGRQTAEALAAQRGMGGRPLQPGEGPTPEEREAGFYDLLFVGESGDGRTLRASVKGDRDPGYGSTCKILSETAFLLRETPRDRLPGGIWTPGAALGQPLIDRLEAKAGLHFAIED